MTRAYDERYVACAQECLGVLFENAPQLLNRPLAAVFELFASSSYARRFETGDCTIVAGKSGYEVACDLLWETGGDVRGVCCAETSLQAATGRSRAYWLGWALAYYQWDTGLPFREIARFASVDTLLDAYQPYHEMDVRQFVDYLNELRANASLPTRLKRLRENRGLSQRELAECSGVPLRTIQQYEQRQKDINKASVSHVLAFSRALRCSMEDLLEYGNPT